jgi:hypothetical protein
MEGRIKEATDKVKARQVELEKLVDETDKIAKRL